MLQLVKDEIQATLESTIGDESCTALAAGNDYFNNGDGAYFKTIPTYKGSISPEYKEFIDFYGTEDFHIDWVQAAFDKTRTNYPSGRGDGIFEEAFGGAGNTKGGECVGYEGEYSFAYERFNQTHFQSVANDLFHPFTIEQSQQNVSRKLPPSPSTTLSPCRRCNRPLIW